jgi:quinol monooxygenase YgiN
MSYVMVRMYSGQRATDEVLKVAAQELMPQIIKAGGCNRYTLVKFADNRFGSVSRYENKAAAEQGAQIAANWVNSTGAMQGTTLQNMYAGEQVYSRDPNFTQSIDGKFGTMRIWNSSASAADARQAFEQEAQPIIDKSQGLLRYTAFRTDDNRLVTLTTAESREAANEMTRQAREAVAKSGSLLSKLMTGTPQVIDGEIFRSFTG